MATVNKDFKVKNGLIVEGTTATVNNFDVLTKKQADQDYIVGLIGGTATSTNTPDAVVKRDANGDFAAGTITADLTGNVSGNVTGNLTGDVTGNVSGNAGTATALETARTIELTGDVTGSVSFDGTANVQISATVDASFATDTEVSTAVSDHSNLTTGVHGVTGDVVGTTDAQTLSNKTLGTDLDAGTFKVINLGLPTAADDAATKAYVDSVAEGLHVHASVVALEDSNITLPTAPTTVDGVTLGVGDRVLLAGQTDSAENGIYVVINGDLARAADYNTAEEIQAGDFVFVSGGTNYAGTGWVQINPVTTLGTDPIVWDQFSGAGTYTAGNGLTLSGTEFSIDTSTTVDLSTAQTLSNKSIDGSSNTLSNIANASLVNDSITVNGTAVALGGSVTLDTDDIAQGATNLYFSDELAQDAVASAIAAGTHQNITITYDDVNNTFTFEAENGVADSTTDDLTEGTNNLYFTDARAVSALEAVVPNFTEVDLNSVATQIAATVNVPTAGVANAHSFPVADYTSAEYLVKVEDGTHTEVSKILLTLDSSNNIAITEYGIVGTNGTLGTVSATISGTDVVLQVTTANNNSDVTVAGTLLK